MLHAAGGGEATGGMTSCEIKASYESLLFMRQIKQVNRGRFRQLSSPDSLESRNLLPNFKSNTGQTFTPSTPLLSSSWALRREGSKPPGDGPGNLFLFWTHKFRRKTLVVVLLLSNLLYVINSSQSHGQNVWFSCRKCLYTGSLISSHTPKKCVFRSSSLVKY